MGQKNAKSADQTTKVVPAKTNPASELTQKHSMTMSSVQTSYQKVIGESDVDVPAVRIVGGREEQLCRAFITEYLKLKGDLHDIKDSNVSIDEVITALHKHKTSLIERQLTRSEKDCKEVPGTIDSVLTSEDGLDKDLIEAITQSTSTVMKHLDLLGKFTVEEELTEKDDLSFSSERTQKVAGSMPIRLASCVQISDQMSSMEAVSTKCSSSGHVQDDGTYKGDLNSDHNAVDEEFYQLPSSFFSTITFSEDMFSHVSCFRLSITKQDQDNRIAFHYRLQPVQGECTHEKPKVQKVEPELKGILKSLPESSNVRDKAGNTGQTANIHKEYSSKKLNKVRFNVAQTKEKDSESKVSKERALRRKRKQEHKQVSARSDSSEDGPSNLRLGTSLCTANDNNSTVMSSSSLKDEEVPQKDENDGLSHETVGISNDSTKQITEVTEAIKSVVTHETTVEKEGQTSELVVVIHENIEGKEGQTIDREKAHMLTSTVSENMGGRTGIAQLNEDNLDMQQTTGNTTKAENDDGEISTACDNSDDNVQQTPLDIIMENNKTAQEDERTKMLEETYSNSNKEEKVNEESDTDIEEDGVHAESRCICMEDWVSLATDEANKGAVAKSVRDSGMDTIFCIDTSESMRGYGWIQACKFIRGFMEEIESVTSIKDQAFEHIGIVTFGRETKVIQHMTCDYLQINEVLDGLRLGGPSPMYGGLLMVAAAILGSGLIRFTTHKVRVGTRVILVSDGQPTQATLIAGEDVVEDTDETKEQKDKIRVLTGYLCRRLQLKLFTVPVGKADTDFLDELAKSGGGKTVSPWGWRRIAKYFKNVIIAGKASELPRALLEAPGLLDQLFECQDEIPEDDLGDVRDILAENMKDRTEHEEADPTMLRLGTRVKRGKDWKWKSQDSNGTGTVVSHPQNASKGWLRVFWDQKDSEGGQANNYRYGAESAYDVQPVDDPRILLGEELIAPGCLVRRGKDWKWENQDGGPNNLGVVLSVDSGGNTWVRWANGHINTYRFGCDGSFDVDLCDPFSPESIQFRQLWLALNAEIVQRAGQTLEIQSVPLVEVSEQTSHVGENAPNETKISDGVKTPESKSLISNKNLSESLKISLQVTEPTWQWMDGTGSWISYPVAVNQMLEMRFQKNPKATVMFELESQRYRVMFAQMKQLNTSTKESVDIQRLAPK